MKLVEVRATASRLPGNLPRVGQKAGIEAAPGRALTIVNSPAQPDANTLTGNRPAEFLAHLIAMKIGCPQTRERRRAEPDEALHAYRSVAAGDFSVCGRNFSKAG